MRASFDNWPSSRENLSSGLPKKRESNHSPQLQRLARKINITPVASLHMILSKKRIAKALIRLRGCEGWSAPVLFENTRRQVFSRRGPCVVHQARLRELHKRSRIPGKLDIKRPPPSILNNVEFPTTWYVRPAKAQTSLCIRAV